MVSKSISEAREIFIIESFMVSIRLRIFSVIVLIMFAFINVGQRRGNVAVKLESLLSIFGISRIKQMFCCQAIGSITNVISSNISTKIINIIDVVQRREQLIDCRRTVGYFSKQVSIIVISNGVSRLLKKKIMLNSVIKIISKVIVFGSLKRRRYYCINISSIKIFFEF